ncbi:hypothetical protein Tco_0453538 [Tanacetum coccineum]
MKVWALSRVLVVHSGVSTPERIHQNAQQVHVIEPIPSSFLGELIQKLLLNQKYMGYLVYAYYSISPISYYKDDSCWSTERIFKAKNKKKAKTKKNPATAGKRPVKCGTTAVDGPNMSRISDFFYSAVIRRWILLSTMHLGPHETFQCQPMNEDYYHEQNSCYDSNSFGFDQVQTPQYTVNHPIFNNLLNSQNKLTEQMTTLRDLVDQVILIRSEEAKLRQSKRCGLSIYVDALHPAVEIRQFRGGGIVDPDVARNNDDILLTIKDDIFVKKL